MKFLKIGLAAFAISLGGTAEAIEQGYNFTGTATITSLYGPLYGQYQIGQKFAVEGGVSITDRNLPFDYTGTVLLDLASYDDPTGLDYFYVSLGPLRGLRGAGFFYGSGSVTFRDGNIVGLRLSADNDGGDYGFISERRFYREVNANYDAVAGKFALDLPDGAVVPEPCNWMLLIAGFGIVGGVRRRTSMRSPKSPAPRPFS